MSKPRRVIARYLGPTLVSLTASVALCQDLERRVVKAVAPPYDRAMVMARAQGTIRYEVSVAPSGEVEDVQVTRPWFGPYRTELYAQYVRQWRFEPAETTTTEEIVFEFRFVPADSPPPEQGTVFVSPTRVEIRHLEPPVFFIGHVSETWGPRSPTEEETRQPWRDEDPNRYLEVRADFDGDGEDDHAAIKISESTKEQTVIVDIGYQSRPPKRELVDVELPLAELPSTGIRLVEPGTYVTACGKGQRECREGETRTISITRPSISLFRHQGGRTFIYWDDETESWASVDIDL